jgi:hypothetical protein
MNTRTHLKTIRLTRGDRLLVKRLHEQHPHLRSFSNLVRACLWNFMKEANPSSLPREDRPSFLWDYPLTPGEIREILAGPRQKRLWLVAKIIEHGKWEEIWDYLTLDLIEADLPYLRLPKQTMEHWRLAINRWRHSV